MSKKLVSGALILSLTLIAWELQAQLHFQDVAAQKGIEHRYLSVRLGGGVSCYDFNQDGLDDITSATPSTFTSIWVDTSSCSHHW